MKKFRCEDCEHVFYDCFCGYKARCCYIHGMIDCNPDSYVDTLEEDEECPDFKRHFLRQDNLIRQAIKNRLNYDSSIHKNDATNILDIYWRKDEKNIFYILSQYIYDLERRLDDINNMLEDYLNEEE